MGRRLRRSEDEAVDRNWAKQKEDHKKEEEKRRKVVIRH
jgi:hypothetical protein